MDDSFRIDVLRRGGADTGWLPRAALSEDGECSFHDSFPGECASARGSRPLAYLFMRLCIPPLLPFARGDADAEMRQKDFNEYNFRKSSSNSCH